MKLIFNYTKWKNNRIRKKIKNGERRKKDSKKKKKVNNI